MTMEEKEEILMGQPLAPSPPSPPARKKGKEEILMGIVADNILKSKFGDSLGDKDDLLYFLLEPQRKRKEQERKKRKKQEQPLAPPPPERKKKRKKTPARKKRKPEQEKQQKESNKKRKMNKIKAPIERSECKLMYNNSKQQSECELTTTMYEFVKNIDSIKQVKRRVDSENTTWYISHKEGVCLGELCYLTICWGYRTGRQTAHELYENESHSNRNIQYYTDIVFRNIQQHCANPENLYIYPRDILDHSQGVTTFVGKHDSDKLKQTTVKKMLCRFITSGDNYPLLKRLASMKLSKASPAFTAIILAAQSLFFLSIGCYRHAYNRLLSINSLFKNHSEIG